MGEALVAQGSKAHPFFLHANEPQNATARPSIIKRQRESKHFIHIGMHGGPNGILTLVIFLLACNLPSLTLLEHLVVALELIALTAGHA